MIFLSKLSGIAARAKFCSPPRNKIAVFDFRNDILEKMILKDIQFTVLPADFGLLYISFPVAFSFMKNFLGLYFRLKPHRRLFFLYLLSCVQVVNPKVVLTVIDNNYLFHMLSQHYRKAQFYAIQNGARNSYDLADALREILNLGLTYSFSRCNFVCFGSYEIDAYRNTGHSIYSKFRPAGSLIGGYYWSQIRQSGSKSNFTICLISQWRRAAILGNEWQAHKKAVQILNDHLMRFISEKKISFCVAAASRDSAEEEYCKNIFGEAAQFIPNNREKFSTYVAMDKSDVVVTLHSTAGYEAFGWGKKVLFCNFYGDKAYDSPAGSLTSITTDNYEEFRNKLNYLLEVDDAEYYRLTDSARKYVMNYDINMPAHAYVRKLIFSC